MASLARLRFEHQLQLDLKMDPRTLFAGDIVAVGTRAPSSVAIQWSTAGEYSHTMLYIGDGLIIDAMPGGGVTQSTLKQRLAGALFGAVFRHRTATSAQLSHATDWARVQIGKKYDFISAANAGLCTSSRTYALRYTLPGQLVTEISELKYEHKLQDTTFTCSELVLRAFEIAGAPLTDIPVYVSSPAILRRTSQLVYMGDLLSTAA